MSREAIISFLRHGASQRVSFSFVTPNGARVVVNETTFQRVASAIETGRITLVETTSFAAGVGAEYCAQAQTSRGIAANTLRVPPQIGRMEQGSLLHESVHASFDLTRSGGVNAADEEAASYIAEYVYYRRTGLAPRRVINDAITRAARPIADAVIRRQPITSAQIAALSSAISGNPTYAGMPTGPYLQDGGNF